MAVNKTRQYNTNDGFEYNAPTPAAFATSGGTVGMFYSKLGAGGYNLKNRSYRIHRFDTVGSHSIYFDEPGFVDVLVVGGGGSGGSAYNYDMGGGGGAGGMIQEFGYQVQQGAYDVVVGAGGFFSYGTGNTNGQNSSFGSLVAFGGGKGGNRNTGEAAPGNGGSGGGGQDGDLRAGSGVEGQGYDGAAGWDDMAGGGGGAGSSGQGGRFGFSPANGGNGLPTYIDNDNGIWMAGGGAGGSRSSRFNERGWAKGGKGGGGDGISVDTNSKGQDAYYYGGGGGGGMSITTGWYAGGNGYQGIVIVRYLVS